jgi:phospholipid/cholesterol/gamma-HCH transport system substrate-binding protein
VVTQAPKRSAVLAALAFTLSCVGLIIFVWTQFGGTIPFAPQGYRIHALFKETGLLVPNADVRISGVNVGKVTSVDARGVNSFVTMDMQHQFAPIPADTRAILRQKTLLGEAYIELSTGSASAPKLPDGGTIPTSQVGATQALDQVLGSFDKPTQQNLQALLNGFGEALAGRGQDLNDAIGNLDPAVTELAAVVGVLNDQQANLQALISDGGSVLTTIGDRSSDVQSLVTAGDQVLSATAARDTSLTATVDALPPFLSELRTTLLTLNTTLGFAKPSLADLEPVAPLLTPALSDLIKLSGPAVKLLREAPALINDSNAALPAITKFSKAFKPALDAILPAARELAPIISFVGAYHLELVGAMANLAADLQATAAANTTASVAGIPAGQASYLRAISMVGRESIYGQTIREPTSRANTYFSPGELGNLSSGLLSANCNNTGNVAQVPASFGNVPCRLQPAFNWGHGILTSYFPHVTRAKLPKK